MVTVPKGVGQPGQTPAIDDLVPIANRWRYLGNNPTNATDPSGLFWKKGWNPSQTYFDQMSAPDRLRWARLSNEGWRYSLNQEGTILASRFNTNDNVNVTVTQQMVDDCGNGAVRHWTFDFNRKILWIDAHYNSSAAAQFASAFAVIEERQGKRDILAAPSPGATLGQSYQQVIPGVSGDTRLAGGQASFLAHAGAQWAAAGFLAIRFGANANQVFHAFRHVDAAGLDRAAVQTAIEANLRANAASVTAGRLYTGNVTVAGRQLEYHAFQLPDGVVNVGRITVP